MTRRKPLEGQADLFASGEEFFPVRRPQDPGRPLDLTLRIKSAMGRALKECSDSSSVIAARISDITGRELTVDALYAYTAPSKTDHDMTLIRFVAFVRATGAKWLWDVLVEDEGLVVLEGREAKLAQVGAFYQQRAMLDGKIDAINSELKSNPVSIGRRRRGKP